MTWHPDARYPSTLAMPIDAAIADVVGNSRNAAVLEMPWSARHTATIPPHLAEQAHRAAERFHTSSRGTIEEVIGIGIELLAIKEVVDKPAFGAWMRRSFGSESRTADNYMQLARAFADRRDVVAALPLTVAYKLAAPTLPAAVREAVLERLAHDPNLEPAVIRSMIADAVAIRKGSTLRRPGKRPRNRSIEAENASVEAARLIASVAGAHRPELSALLAHCDHGLGLLIRQALQAEMQRSAKDEPNR
ncbi:hypothetical protein [Antarcticirhabdus aurantiaca]|uniref:Uncharacterized protein n=1 Tax=Antarcticirhabdus aurantiaca TaxID=2606717 RepID=A0ACD4NNU0_9HYPH|nr:hypothetical protein [Antarcticirhabdus aurantiaca]WAJ28384.1 hypothetical protein OXU80_26840 [Jeongeuplla avenae]